MKSATGNVERINDDREHSGISESNHRVKYGWRSFRPEALQCLSNAKWLLFFLCLSNFSQTMATNGFVGSILSTLETRFGLKSTESALVASAYEIGTVPALVLVALFGNRLNRAKWIGIGMFVCSVGSVLFVIPHYVSGLYSYSAGSTELTCYSNSTECDSTDSDTSSDHYLYILLVVGNILHGVGTTPLLTVGVAYLDDMVTKDTSALFMGIFYSMGVLGPAVGYIGGGFLLDLFTDFDAVDTDSVEITNQDPRWVGSWWLGFWINVLITLLVALPLTGFPKDIPGAAEKRCLRESEAHGDTEMMTSRPDFGYKWKDICTVIVSLFKNTPFVFLTLTQVTEAIIIQGFAAFGPKYVQNQFLITSTLAAIVFGAMVVVGGAGGTVVGGYVTKRFKMNYSNIMKLNLAMHIVVTALTFEFIFRCPSPSYAGVNTAYNGSTLPSGSYTLLESCNSHCTCSPFRFEPVCGENSLMYYSACFAGCTDYKMAEESKEFFNCSCINSVNSTVPAATSSVCESDCFMLPVFIVLFFITMFCTFVASICSVNATLRTVPRKEVANGIALQWIFLRLLGTIPAPLIFGVALDSTCILWDSKCEQAHTSCLLYDTSTMGVNMIMICGILKALTIIFVVLAWKLHKPPPAVPQALAESAAPSTETVYTEL